MCLKLFVDTARELAKQVGRREDLCSIDIELWDVGGFAEQQILQGCMCLWGFLECQGLYGDMVCLCRGSYHVFLLAAAGGKLRAMHTSRILRISCKGPSAVIYRRSKYRSLPGTPR